MKIQSYESVINKDIIAVKTYLLEISEGCWMQDIHDLINMSMDGMMIKKKLNHRKDLRLIIFSKIKILIDQSISFDEMENHLVMLNLLLNQDYQPLVIYKHNLLNYIVEKAGFNEKTYCLLRHLIKFNVNRIESFIETLAIKLNLSIERYHYLAAYILLIEKKYKKAYGHLEYVTFDEKLKYYLPALYNYSPWLYYKYSKKKEMLLKPILV